MSHYPIARSRYTPAQMLSLELVFAALFGLALGSFLNVCIVRLPRGESVVHPPSHCPICRKPIRPSDNIPLLSWLLLRGRSRCCGQPIALRYPLVEAATALLFTGCVVAFGLTVTGVGMAVLGWLLLGLAWIDAETFLLPDAFTLPGLALGILFQVFAPDRLGIGNDLLQSIVSAVGIGGLLLLIALLYKAVRKRDGMGIGDVKLAAMLGAWFGWQLAAVALFLAVVTGAVFGIAMLAGGFQRKEAREDGNPQRLPFGSFLAAAGVATMFAGRPLLAWYLHFFDF